MIQLTIMLVAVATIVGGVYGILGNAGTSATTITAQKTEIARLEGKLRGAEMRVDRRNDAIGALPAQCRDKALGYIKSGDIPKPFKPFADTGSGAGN